MMKDTGQERTFARFTLAIALRRRYLCGHVAEMDVQEVTVWNCPDIEPFAERFKLLLDRQKRLFSHSPLIGMPEEGTLDTRKDIHDSTSQHLRSRSAVERFGEVVEVEVAPFAVEDGDGVAAGLEHPHECGSVEGGGR